MDFEENNNLSCSMNESDQQDWDQPFTDQVLQAVEAVEAAFRSPPVTSSSSSLSSSLNKKRTFSADRYNDRRPSIRRQLPNSVIGIVNPSPFLLSPCQATPRMRYPEMKFGGRIIYSRSAKEVEKAAMELLQNFEAKRRETGQVTLGLDIEWRPTFRRGISPGKAAVLQICADINHCHVMHIIHSGIPQSLQLLLEDSSLKKVGVGIDNDAAKVFRDYDISIKAVEDISNLANQKIAGDAQKWSLQSLTVRLVCKELPKPNKIRLGNWEAKPLSKEQLQYAATDAFVSWHLYEVLKSLPDVIREPADEN